MPRKKRAENAGLPARWRRKHGAYRYQVPPGLESKWDGKKEFRLGKTLAEAHRVWASRIELYIDAFTIGQLLDRYSAEVVPKKAPKNATENTRSIVRLKSVFGDMPIPAIEPQHIYQYVNKRLKVTEGGKKSKGLTAAHREIEVLSHAYTKAVEWGFMSRHPFKEQVRLDGSLALKARTRYVEDWEVLEVLSIKSFRKRGSVLAIQAYVRLKMLTGMARSDLLRLRFGEHIRDDGIYVTRHKTKEGKPTIYDYAKVPERKDAVEQAMKARPVDISPFLFCNKRGKGYFNEATGTCNGFDSMWQRFMDRVLNETKVTQRFTEHDLRAKVGSDAESLEKARALLQHADSRTTQRIYRRKPERV
jgi:integrase